MHGRRTRRYNMPMRTQSVYFLPTMFSWQMRHRHYSVGKQTRGTKQRKEHRQSTRRKLTMGNAAGSSQSSTRTQTHSTTTATLTPVTQAAPRRWKRPFAHTPSLFGLWDMSEQGAHQTHSRLWGSSQAPLLRLGTCGTSPQSSAGHWSFPCSTKPPRGPISAEVPAPEPGSRRGGTGAPCLVSAAPAARTQCSHGAHRGLSPSCAGSVVLPVGPHQDRT